MCVLRELEEDSKIVEFAPGGSDERQYCSPGFDLPVGSLMRSVYNEYPQYHTSLDNREFISFEAIQGSVDAYCRICLALDMNVVYRNVLPFGEPQLGRRDVLPAFTPGHVYSADTERWAWAIKWVLNLADGKHDLISIAERSKIDLQLLQSAALACVASGLLVRDVSAR